MQIATWNVNSIRTRLDQVQAWLQDAQPDLLCLQETKVDDPQFPHEVFEAQGYQVHFHGQKAYNGVAIVSRQPLEDVRRGFTGELPEDAEALQLGEQKRVISALVNNIRIVNVYVPNGSALRSEKYPYKLEWLSCLNRYLSAQAKRDEPLCLVGDFNIALEARDIHHPERLTGGIMASELEREALLKVLGDRLHDVFRVFEPDAKHWSWWDYRSGAWDRDQGWRIDHIYLCDELLSQARSCVIQKHLRGHEKPSDHAPVSVDLNWPPTDDDEEMSELFSN
ncbi:MULTISPECIES: exodeoxyribonuclease III [Prochlorococcus]|uniref:exodeoxyribonuclease III n=1 Tax=Prochlorococcus TaxID=1218 RepID=UPI0007B3CD9A|nr:exodeoxyribonuclease III [Prochlorococcus marinus]NMO85231.1 exodeoxyribonuclease III [Prochlorococcus sp. P1344]NMP07036.1 exodeoxyribonuclease III [Prochlorococcus sp. P1361]NMP14419.1 exodeoxyribonuclease III [Prochlorococcus sp.P1363]KZR62710.1 Exodeoxyribonuclease III [Prochlorococcus marinus str. MIT 1312]KZR80809.1 Exodeoxyribonuclease III [Prochlorococcus marinus str. MIT 1327]